MPRGFSDVVDWSALLIDLWRHLDGSCPSWDTNRDRGEPRGSAPPTPPYVRVRIRRFGGLSSTLGHQGCDAKRGEEGLREGNVERGAVAQPPRAMWAAGGSCRQLPADAAASQLLVACASAF